MAEEYSGLERDVTFVAKAKDRLWNYCVARHRERWNGERRVPLGVQHEGKTGWWFPKAWVADFIDRHGEQVSSTWRPRLDLAARTAHVIRTVSRLSWGDQISANEAQFWRLTEGSQVTPWEVIYPDGNRESIDALRLRHGKFRAGAPAQSVEQQNLEAILNAIHRRDRAA